MVLPLYLAVTGAEMSVISDKSYPIAYMACHFSPYTQGLANLPAHLPPGSMLILNDRMPCRGHSADLIIGQLRDVMDRYGCESLLLDLQRPPEEESANMVRKITESLPRPVAVTESYARNLRCPVLLSPVPLHVSLADYLKPWSGREVWLEAALQQEEITVTETGTDNANRFPPDCLEGGFFDEALCCNYMIKTTPDQIKFILFDTPATLCKKLNLAHSLGVTQAVGLWQELGTFLPGK